MWVGLVLLTRYTTGHKLTAHGCTANTYYEGYIVRTLMGPNASYSRPCSDAIGHDGWLG